MLDRISDAEGREVVTGELVLRLHTIPTQEVRKVCPLWWFHI